MGYVKVGRIQHTWLRQSLRFRQRIFTVPKTDNQSFNANGKKNKQPVFLISQQAGYATVSARSFRYRSPSPPEQSKTSDRKPSPGPVDRQGFSNLFFDG